MIFSELSPNTQKDDFQIVLNRIIRPGKYLEGDYPGKINDWFKQHLRAEIVFSYDSGRSALFAILKGLGIKKGDEVALQAFTCVAASNPIIWKGAKPLFIDIDPKTYTIDADDLRRKITPKTKAIIVQHTFGYPADIREVLDIACPKGIYVIEDCAHSIGGESGGKKLGTFGDAAFFSFGRDKAISASFGGVAVTRDKTLRMKLEKEYRTMKYPRKMWITRQMLYTIVGYLTRKYYTTAALGKFIHAAFLKTGLIHLPTSRGENKHAHIPEHALSKLPDAFAHIAYHQIEKLEKMNKNRNYICKYYLKELSELASSAFILPGWNMTDSIYPVRLPILVQNRRDIIDYAKIHGVILGNWYEVPVAPKAVDQRKAGYVIGSCKQAESVSQRVINLPIHGTMTWEEAKNVINIIKLYFQSN